MSGLISGIGSLFGNVGGSSAKRDRSEQLDSYTDLANVFNFGMGQAKSNATAGANDTGAASSFFKNVLGNRTAATQAAAPEIAGAASANDASKRQLATSGTARGGGTAGFNQTRNEDMMGKIDQMLFGARTGAAGEEAKIGAGETTAGIEDTFAADKSASQLGEMATKSRDLSSKLHQNAVDNITGGITDILGWGLNAFPGSPDWMNG
jgi:hypothetical protein